MLTEIHFAFLARGALWTIVLSLLSFAGGGSIGAAIALLRISPIGPVRHVTGLLTFALQGTPLLVILFVFYYGVPQLGIPVPPMAAAIAGLSLYAACYLGEIWQGCLMAVPRAQWEAAKSLSLSRSQRMVRIIAPQAVKLAIPQTVGFMVQIVKGTSLASILGFVELMRSATVLNNSLFIPFQVYIIVAIIYFAICYPLSAISRKLERRLTLKLSA